MQVAAEHGRGGKCVDQGRGDIVRLDRAQPQAGEARDGAQSPDQPGQVRPVRQVAPIGAKMNTGQDDLTVTFGDKMPRFFVDAGGGRLR